MLRCLYVPKGQRILICSKHPSSARGLHRMIDQRLTHCISCDPLTEPPWKMQAECTLRSQRWSGLTNRWSEGRICQARLWFITNTGGTIECSSTVETYCTLLGLGPNQPNILLSILPYWAKYSPQTLTRATVMHDISWLCLSSDLSKACKLVPISIDLIVVILLYVISCLVLQTPW